MVLDGHISNQLCTCLLFSYSRHSCHSTFFGCNEAIDCNQISFLVLIRNVFS
nr:MAG TPA: hypothetical protein [Bacteriophage sp.]